MNAFDRALVKAAQGGLPVVIAQAHQHLTGIGADLPVVRPIFEKYVASHGLQERLRFAAIDFFKENAAKTEQDIIVEVDRYIVWPGQALGYKVGQLKIRELRTRAEQLMTGRFDLRKFHDVVLGQGAVPLDVLERRVEAWVTAGGAR